jgi:DNA-directed DNA polymerase III PolC
MGFTHLEVHSHFTLLGATPSVEELTARARDDKLSHLALTDTNALYGAVAFARACRAAEIQPVIGMTLAVMEPDLPPPLPEKADAGPGQLVLLATGPVGYRSLCRLSSLIQASPEREALAARGIAWDDLVAYREGLICLSGGRRGWIERYLRAGDYAAAQLCAGRLAGVFEEDAALALELHSPEDERVATEVVALARRLGLPAVAVQPVYCLTPSDAPKLRLLAAIRANVLLNNPIEFAVDESEREGAESAEANEEPSETRRDPSLKSRRDSGLGSHPLRMTARDFTGFAVSGLTGSSARLTEINDRATSCLEESHHWLSPAEVATRFMRFPQAIARAGEIAARCGECLPDGRAIWPSLKLPATQIPDEALAELAWAGYLKLETPDRKLEAGNLELEAKNSELENGDDNPLSTSSNRLSATGFRQPASSNQLPASARLAHELSAINSHGYAPLFLVVADIVRFARGHDIPVSTRGSVANSLVAYCAGITTVDPIEHGLLFERFLNPARANPPDIDLDFCSRRRDEVLRYVRDTYGPDHVALIGTVSTLRPQSAVRETGKAVGLADARIDHLVRLLPHGWHPDPRRRDKHTMDDVLAALDDPAEQEVVRMAYGLVGQPDHLSVHPGGVVITPGPLTDVLPVQWAPKGFLITQFEHGDVEALGLPKMDLLGIRALTVLADAAELARRRHDPAFRLADIPLDDPATAALIERAETIGVFQCESDGAQRTLRKLRARTVADLAIANAFFKPGPAMGGMAAAFVRRYRGEEAVAYLHPALKPILGPTKGVLIFQEQILRLAREIAGLTWAQADQLRRGMSHFGADQMTAIREQFVQGCRRPPPEGPGFSLAQANTLWDQVMPFAGYGFNQGHATAYADVSFRSAYLKAHYPAEFLCARLADHGGFHHPAIYMAEAVRLRLAVRPPHVNFSGEGFTLANQRTPAPTGRCGVNESASRRTDADSPFATLFMGLGQVRDLRHAAIAGILQERERAAFTGVRDLLRRVDLRAKEIDHLIRCGALDGLAESRAALLAETGQISRGSAEQMTFDFAPPEVASETLRQRWDWEAELLGLPVSAFADPLALVRERLPIHTPLAALADSRGRPTAAVGVRLPGWTGGPGFFMGDGDTFVIVRTEKTAKHPPPWQPLLVKGRWVGDGWGSFWLHADQISPVQTV